MVWQEIDGGKPPLKYDKSEEEKKVSKEITKNEEEQFTSELKTGIMKPEPISKPKPIVTVFDSHKGYKGKRNET